MGTLEHYLSLTKQIKKKRDELDELVDKRQPLIARVKKHIHKDLGGFFEEYFGKEYVYDFNLIKAKQFITLRDKDTYEIKRNTQLKKHYTPQQQRRLEEKYQKRGYLVEVWNTGGQSGKPFRISDTDSSLASICVTYFHESTHNYHDDTFAPAFYLENTESITIFETAAEVIGLHLTEDYSQKVDSKRKIILRKGLDWKRKYRLAEQDIYSGLVELLRTKPDENKLQEFFDEKKEAHKKVAIFDKLNVPYIMRMGVYCGDSKVYHLLDEMYSRCTSARTFADLSGLQTTFDQLESTIDKMEELMRWEYTDLKSYSEYVQRQLERELFTSRRPWPVRLQNSQEMMIDYTIAQNEFFMRGYMDVFAELQDSMKHVKSFDERLLKDEYYKEYYFNQQATHIFPPMMIRTAVNTTDFLLKRP